MAVLKDIESRRQVGKQTRIYAVHWNVDMTVAVSELTRNLLNN